MTARARERAALAAVWALILGYAIFFSALSIQRHRAFLTHASDLGQIDQAIWNTLQGHWLEHTKATGAQNIRLSDHVEPIFIPLSLVFALDDNVEALLVVQTAAIALGALAVFWIARKRWSEALAAGDGSPWPDLLGVGFAAMYLFFPALEAANLAEFHAVTLAPAPLLFAYHYGTEQRWGRFAFFAVLALAVKEEISLLVLMLGLWFWVEPALAGWRRSQRWPRFNASSRPVPLLIALAALGWFGLTYGWIIPHFNQLGRSPYTCRYIVSEDCRTAAPGLFLGERLGYLGGLLASAGWIALLDPLGLLLGLPLIAANVLSNYPAQYSGTYHYSAPVAPYFVLAAIGGSARLAEWIKRRSAARAEVNAANRPRPPVRVPAPAFALAAFLLAFGFHLAAGYTPLGGAFQWPEITAHNRLFERMATQIPREAVVSTTASLNPHLSHRRVLYRYPVVNDADYVLLDVSESANANPVDFRVAYDDLLGRQGFGVVDAADGYVLLKRGFTNAVLGNEFYSAFRASQPRPQHSVTVDFGDKVRFLGYDVLTDAYGRGSLQLYWQRLSPMDRNYYLYPFYADQQGSPRKDVTYDLSLLYWYPTAAWLPNETVVGRTVPLDLGPRARLALGVMDGDDWDAIDRRLPLRLASPGNLATFDDSTWVELGVLVKQGNRYIVEPTGK